MRMFPLFSYISIKHFICLIALIPDTTLNLMGNFVFTKIIRFELKRDEKICYIYIWRYATVYMYVYHIYKTRWKYVNKVQQICWSKNASVLEIRWIERDTTKTITNLRHICLHYVYTSHIYIISPVLYFGYIFFRLIEFRYQKLIKALKYKKKITCLLRLTLRLS